MQQILLPLFPRPSHTRRHDNCRGTTHGQRRMRASCKIMETASFVPPMPHYYRDDAQVADNPCIITTLTPQFLSLFAHCGHAFQNQPPALLDSARGYHTPSNSSSCEVQSIQDTVPHLQLSSAMVMFFLDIIQLSCVNTPGKNKASQPPFHWVLKPFSVLTIVTPMAAGLHLGYGYDGR